MYTNSPPSNLKNKYYQFKSSQPLSNIGLHIAKEVPSHSDDSSNKHSYNFIDFDFEEFISQYKHLPKSRHRDFYHLHEVCHNSSLLFADFDLNTHITYLLI